MSTPIISLVAAIGKNRELGKDNKLLWHISDDLKHFKEVTSGHVVIMGRKTFESIGRPLPNRVNIIVSRNTDYKPDNVLVVKSLEQALVTARQHETRGKIMVIGGGQIFTQALPQADRLYLTIVDSSFDADTFFPDYSNFTTTISKEDRESEGYRYSFLVLEK